MTKRNYLESNNKKEEQIESRKDGMVMEMKNVKEITTNVYAEDEFGETKDFETDEGTFRIMDYIGVQDYLADAMLGEINSLSEAKRLFQEYLIYCPEIMDWNEIVRIYNGDIKKIAFSIKCHFIDNYLYSPEDMLVEIYDDRKDYLLKEGLIIEEDDENYYEDMLVSQWTYLLEEECLGLSPDKIRSEQELFADIRDNYRGMAILNKEQDDFTKKFHRFETIRAEKYGKTVKEQRCPRCRNLIVGCPDISIFDNETEICSRCGQELSLRQAGVPTEAIIKIGFETLALQNRWLEEEMAKSGISA